MTNSITSRTAELFIQVCHAIQHAHLVGQIRGDLDWIVMKALEKERSRRYETVNGLALDVTRFLEREPILARPPSRIYRLGKLLHKHRAVFTAAAALVLALAAGLTGTLWEWRKAEKSLVAQRIIAESRASQKNATAAALYELQAREEALQREEESFVY